MAKRRKRPTRVFLNIPYDKKFERLFLAYIAGISALGLIPRATLEITDSRRRLDKILKLINECEYSVHDLSRVELDRRKPRTPRFNMPFELGLCVAETKRAHRDKENWLVFEAVEHRIDKSLSDLKGTDAKIHGGRIDGVFAEICNSLKPRGRRPTVPQMRRIYREVRKGLPGVLQESGSKNVYGARAFADISAVASA